MADPDDRDGVWAKCPDCGKESQLFYDDYGNPGPITLRIAACESAGVYSVDFQCPHCGVKSNIY